MRRALAAILDTAVGLLAAFGAFRLALVTAPCGGNQGECFALTPLTIVFILTVLGLYFLLPQFLMGRSVAQALLRVQPATDAEEE